MEKYFPVEKIIKTGNPVRQNFDNLSSLRADALTYFNLKEDKPIALILGGSLGAGSINASLSENIQKVIDSKIQWIWQTGKNYYEDVKALVSVTSAKNITVHAFIDRMDFAFAAADIIVSRAGAGTISELCLVGKPVILVPSPNVAEDHQTKNALALADKESAVLVSDDKAIEQLVDETIRLISDIGKRKTLSENIAKLADRDADIRIAQEVLKLIKE